MNITRKQLAMPAADFADVVENMRRQEAQEREAITRIPPCLNCWADDPKSGAAHGCGRCIAEEILREWGCGTGSTLSNKVLRSGARRLIDGYGESFRLSGLIAWLRGVSTMASKMAENMEAMVADSTGAEREAELAGAFDEDDEG